MDGTEAICQLIAWSVLSLCFLRSGFSFFQPELGVESSDRHYPITLDPKETGRQLVCLDAHGRIDSLGPVSF